jgi:hypothetical protein
MTRTTRSVHPGIPTQLPSCQVARLLRHQRPQKLATLVSSRCVGPAQNRPRPSCGGGGRSRRSRSASCGGSRTAPNDRPIVWDCRPQFFSVVRGCGGNAQVSGPVMWVGRAWEPRDSHTTEGACPSCGASPGGSDNPVAHCGSGLLGLPRQAARQAPRSREAAGSGAGREGRSALKAPSILLQPHTTGRCQATRPPRHQKSRNLAAGARQAPCGIRGRAAWLPRASDRS